MEVYGDGNVRMEVCGMEVCVWGWKCEDGGVWDEIHVCGMRYVGMEVCGYGGMGWKCVVMEVCDGGVCGDGGE